MLAFLLALVSSLRDIKLYGLQSLKLFWYGPLGSMKTMTTLTPSIIRQITDIVGKDFCTSRKIDLHCYSYDGKGITYLPEAVAFPRTTDHVSKIMKLATLHKFPVVPRGAGTGKTGGSVPVEGGLILALSRMNSIVEIDAANHIAVVEPGVINLDLQKAAAKHGLFFAPDPASLKYATIGGNAAECAGGPSAVKYGVTKDSIIGLEAVLASGDVVTAGVRTEKGVTGYDLTRLFIGSEGTLGVITKLICRLLPLPERKETFLVLSESMREAAQFVSTILNAGTRPRTIEYMDKVAIGVVADIMPTPPPAGTEALLIVELDGDIEEVEKETKALLALLAKHPAITYQHAKNQEEVDDIWQARRSLSPASMKIRPNKISEDIVVPRSRIPDLVSFLEDLSRDLDVPIITFGHAGDGNIHVGIMVDKKNKDEYARGEKAKEILFAHTISLGGTLSGEHGIGITKSAFLSMELTDTTVTLMKQIKSTMDPHNLLNPGKIFPETTHSHGN